MKAVMLKALNPPDSGRVNPPDSGRVNQLELVEIEIPSIKADQVLIKTGASTICTSDLNDLRENPFGIPLPVVIGHEGAGTVAAVGAAVQGFRPGDRVTTHSVYSCGKCLACREGMQHLCLQMEHFGINLQGTLAEYYPARADRVRRIPDSVDFPLASLSEPVSVCLEALAQARLSPGRSLLIIGDGPFGQIINRLAAAFELSKVVMAGWLDFRLSFARGAVRLNTSRVTDPAKAMKEAVGGSGYDAVIVAVGSAQAFANGLKCLKPKGRLVVFSAIQGETPVDLFWVHLKELEIIGACNDQNRYDEAVRMLSNPHLGLSEVITHHFAIQDYHQAFNLAEHGHERALKVSFVF
jgi:threonine dehydrogenase-like Zn-dependent dehydrogenase